MQLYVVHCHIVRAEIAVTMAMPIENPAECTVGGVTRFLKADEILGYLGRRGKFSRGIVLLHDNTRSHTARQIKALLREKLHWDIFQHSPYNPDLAPSDFFLFLKMKEHLVGKRFANDGRPEECCRRPHGMKRVHTNWCQGTTSALMSKASMWNSRQRYAPQLVYPVSVL